jgi:CHASE3 domain sensor protein
LPGPGFSASDIGRSEQAANLAHERSRQVLETLDRLKTVIADVEAQRRGYLLTLDPSYLKAYGVSDESVRRDAQALQALVAGDPLQNHRAGHLALTVAAKLREIDDIVKTAQTSSGPAALAMIRSLDEIRSQIDQMVDHERFLLVDQERRAEALDTPQDVADHDGSRHCRSPGGGGAGARTAGSNPAAEGDRGERRAPRRSPGTRQEDPAPGRLQHRRIIIWEVEGRILEANGRVSPHGRIRPGGSPPQVALHRDNADAAGMGATRDALTVAELKRIGLPSHSRRSTCTKTEAACRC